MCVSRSTGVCIYASFSTSRGAQRSVRRAGAGQSPLAAWPSRVTSGIARALRISTLNLSPLHHLPFSHVNSSVRKCTLGGAMHSCARAGVTLQAAGLDLRGRIPASAMQTAARVPLPAPPPIIYMQQLKKFAQRWARFCWWITSYADVNGQNISLHCAQVYSELNFIKLMYYDSYRCKNLGQVHCSFGWRKYIFFAMIILQIDVNCCGFS